MAHVFNVQKGTVHFATSEIDWVIGHSFIVYGPLIRGAQCVFFEGKPLAPNPGVVYDRVQHYKANSRVMAPTGFRVVKKEDNESD